jgi:hypothetical protein
MHRRTKAYEVSLMRRGENNTGVDSSIWLMNTDTLNDERGGESER